MDQSNFLARFKSTAPLAPPMFDKAELAHWANEFRASLSARYDALAKQFAQALELAGGQFYVARDSEDAAATVLQIAKARGAKSVIAWNHPTLAVACAALQGAGIAVTLSDRATGLERDAIRSATIAAPIGLTSCDFAIAETGTLLLVGNAAQGRLTSLVPITHVALITPAQLVPTLADALKLLRLERLNGDGRLPSNISLHTGPSKTADIEQTLTKGVHGPKEVHVILVME